jgi:hypothetical protein
MTTIENKQYFLHQVDRWPHSFAYGEGRYIYVDGHHYPIEKLDNEKKEVVTTKGKVIKLGKNEPSYDLFLEVMGKPWDEFYKKRCKEDDEENYTDYVPLFYRTIDAYLNDKGEFYNK